MIRSLMRQIGMAVVAAMSVSAGWSAEAAERPSTNDKSHPWSGKKVVYLGDSITAPSSVMKYWKFLQDMYGIEPCVYAFSGCQWSDIYPLAQKMRTEQEESPDAILILLGTNDYNASTPIGEWFRVEKEEVNRNGRRISLPRRYFVKDTATFRGRINTVMGYLKHNFPDQQIVIMTPPHRGYANFGEKNVQPPECFPNALGIYFEEYVRVLREAADIWSVPLIDLYRDCGLLPEDSAYAKYFCGGGERGKDKLHPCKLGHLRMSSVIAAGLRALPPDFKQVRLAE